MARMTVAPNLCRSRGETALTVACVPTGMNTGVSIVPCGVCNNPARARIRIIREPYTDIYVPVYAGEYTPAECAGRDKYTIDGKEYDECAFCRASCPSRPEFKEPDSGLPLKCDMCEGEDEPLCVKWCLADALIYEKREEEVDEAVEQEELEIGLESLVDKHGMQKLRETLARLATKEE